MAQSSRAAGKGQRKWNNVSVGVAPPPPCSSFAVTAPFSASLTAGGAANAAKTLL